MNKLQGVHSHNVLYWGFWLLGLKGKAWEALGDVLLYLGSHLGPVEPVTHEI